MKNPNCRMSQTLGGSSLFTIYLEFKLGSSVTIIKSLIIYKFQFLLSKSVFLVCVSGIRSRHQELEPKCNVNVPV